MHALQYSSPALQEIRQRNGDIDVMVRTDLENLGAIFVYDSQSHRYIKAKCTLPEYAEGITAEQHRWMLSKARKDYRASPLHLALLASKAALRDDTARLTKQCYPEKSKRRRSKPAVRDREVLMQHEETLQVQRLETERETEGGAADDLRNSDCEIEQSRAIVRFPVRQAHLDRMPVNSTANKPD
ncbi:hypothetical protein R69746_08437 [Paraburkholderia aspalathi]|nr:hypothetical protein [Paraburkholderia aspalathi]CAE6871130.1 hypothetical protein R69746_08437 [Paraburkholderia aspalathi]